MESETRSVDNYTATQADCFARDIIQDDGPTCKVLMKRPRGPQGTEQSRLVGSCVLLRCCGKTGLDILLLAGPCRSG